MSKFRLSSAVIDSILAPGTIGSVKNDASQGIVFVLLDVAAPIVAHICSRRRESAIIELRDSILFECTLLMSVISSTCLSCDTPTYLCY